jgi:hypothetical protein
VEEALREALLADAGVSAIVAGRVSWGARPQASALPAIILHVVSAPMDHTHRGRTELVGHLVQIDCWGGAYLAAKTLARAVLAALDGMKTPPLQAFPLDVRDDDFTQGDGPDASGASDFYRTSIDARIWHS